MCHGTDVMRRLQPRTLFNCAHLHTSSPRTSIHHIPTVEWSGVPLNAISKCYILVTNVWHVQITIVHINNWRQCISEKSLGFIQYALYPDEFIVRKDSFFEALNTFEILKIRIFLKYGHNFTDLHPTSYQLLVCTAVKCSAIWQSSDMACYHERWNGQDAANRFTMETHKQRTK